MWYIQTTYYCLSIYKGVSGICDERNWPYQCGVPQICIQLDEQSNSFPPTVLLLPLSTVMHISCLHWWVSVRVCYMYKKIIVRIIFQYAKVRWMTLYVISIGSLWPLYSNSEVHLNYFLGCIVCISNDSQNLSCFIATH